MSLTIDYSAVVTALQTQIGNAMTAGFPVWGTILGIGVGLALFKKLAKGR